MYVPRAHLGCVVQRGTLVRHGAQELVSALYHAEAGDSSVMVRMGWGGAKAAPAMPIFLSGLLVVPLRYRSERASRGRDGLGHVGLTVRQ
jgi:hypothetical protein